MAIKNNEVLNIIAKAFHGDKAMLIDYCTELMNAEKEGSTFKKQLMQILNRQPKELAQLKLDEKYAFQVLDNKNIDEVFLSEENKEIINSFFKEQQNKDKFVEHGIPVSNKIFLTGAPGNGKTTLAGAIAKEMNLPLFNFNISTLFSSYMGQTSERINSVFSKLSNINCVLFMDEMDAMFSKRDSDSERGGNNLENIKIVSSLLLEIDKMPTNIILISATNNESLVDHAVKRRFNYFLSINEPTREGKEKYLNMIAKKYEKLPVLDIVKSKKEEILKEHNIALIDNFVMKEIKKYIMEH